MIDGQASAGLRAVAFLWVAGLFCGPLTVPVSAQTALIDAVKSGSAAAVSHLLEEGVDPNGAEPDGTTPLHWAIQRNDQDTAHRLIRGGAAVDVTNRYGVTPLALASTNGSVAMVEALLAGGATPETASPGSRSCATSTCSREKPRKERTAPEDDSLVTCLGNLVDEQHLIVVVEDVAELVWTSVLAESTRCREQCVSS